jgi:hypothetical protein
MTDDLRADLAACIAERDKARQAFNVADAAAKRAAELLVEADNALATYADLDVEVLQARGDRLAEAITAGDDVRRVASGWVPDDLRDRLLDRNRAAEAAETTRAASVALDIERVRVEARLREAEGTVVRRAAAILMAEAEELAADFVVAQRLAWLLKTRLEGLAAVWLPRLAHTSPSPIAVPDIVRDALAMEAAQVPGNAPLPTVWASTLWQEYLHRLADDPEAQFEPRDPDPIVRMPQPAGTVLFRAQGDIEAERVAAKAAVDAEAKANAPIPAVAASAIELARLHASDA